MSNQAFELGSKQSDRPASGASGLSKKSLVLAAIVGAAATAVAGAVWAAKYSLPAAEQGVYCQDGETLREAVSAFNGQFVGENANAVVIKGLIDKGEVRVRRLSDLTIASIGGKVVVCAIVSSNR